MTDPISRLPGLILLAGVFSFFASLPVGAIPLTGANGKTVEFAGVKSAGPNGLTVQVTADGQVFELGWAKLDLAKVRAQYPKIDAAYTKALGGESTELNLGTFAPKEPAAPAKPQMTVEESAAKRGYFEVNAGRIGQFAVVTPRSANPKGILLMSRGNSGGANRHLSRTREAGPWKDFHDELDFAIMSYSFDYDRTDPGVPEFIYPEKGSGDALIEALGSLSEKSGVDLTGLPIAIYGTDILGAAFAFNFTQWKPEKVIATVAAKGAFYSAEPTEESAKVPLLMIWGEYDKEADVFDATHRHAEIFGKHVNLKPNWVYAMEYRGNPGESPLVFHFSKVFLKRMIKARSSDDGLIEIDRSQGWLGDLDEFTIAKLEDPDAMLPTTKTWIPDAELAEMWKQFADGKLPIPESNDGVPVP